jgi:predicted 2-oxoglutarate/Fe(II)-dependent dioxygenase YbiX
VFFSVGDRIPAIIGATAGGRFYSLDFQAGRPAVLIALGSLEPHLAKPVLDRVLAAQGLLQAAGVDAVPIAPAAAALEWALAAAPEVREQIVYVAEACGLEMCELDGSPAAIIIDRNGRIIGMLPFDDGADLIGGYRHTSASRSFEPPRQCTSSAPVLIIPNVASPQFCQAVIDHFESSPHEAGVMASVRDGAQIAKLDESKKRRRDVELEPGAVLHGQVLDILARRCVPEIKRAFQKDIAFIDRILIARYDDTGGYFKRHRDNTTPHTQFRQFAISINLNTQDYEGGQLLFPEYDDHGYSPAAGSAIVFSASLLHEAAPVLKGSRYVLLSFFCGAAEADAAQSA